MKTLGGFRKGHHTLPDAANETTNAFLAKICAGELAGEAERLFQDTRTALGYKRRELALETAGGSALLTAKDFTVEIAYALEPADPARYAVTTTLRGLRSESTSPPGACVSSSTRHARRTASGTDASRSSATKS